MTITIKLNEMVNEVENGIIRKKAKDIISNLTVENGFEVVEQLAKLGKEYCITKNTDFLNDSLKLLDIESELFLKCMEI